MRHWRAITGHHLEAPHKSTPIWWTGLRKISMLAHTRFPSGCFPSRLPQNYCIMLCIQFLYILQDAQCKYRLSLSLIHHPYLLHHIFPADYWKHTYFLKMSWKVFVGISLLFKDAAELNRLKEEKNHTRRESPNLFEWQLSPNFLSCVSDTRQ